MRAFRTWSAKAMLITFPLLGLLAALISVHTPLSPTLPASRSVPPRSQIATEVLSTAHPFLGVRESGSPGNWAPVTKFAHSVHSNPSLVLYYSNWLERFQIGFARAAWSHHATLVVQMQPWSTPLRTIASGRYDSYLRAFASQVRDFGHPVVIGFGHEMNGTWYPWGWQHQKPAAFVAAWRHIVSVFWSQGAFNVTWLWTVSHDTARTGPLQAYWPGKNYVTWVGLDGYYYHTGDTFQSVFGWKIHRIRQLTTKPLLLAEVGAGQVAGQARIIPGLFRGVRARHLAGLIWFDVHQSGSLYKQDWRLEGHPVAVRVFRRAAAGLLHS